MFLRHGCTFLRVQATHTQVTDLFILRLQCFLHLADGLSGFVVWLPGTIVIKAITALCFSRKTEKIICVRNLLGIIPALVICVVCYSLYEGIFMAGGFSKSAIISAFGQTPAYCIQVLASSILYIVLGLAFDKAGLKKKFSHLFG